MAYVDRSVEEFVGAVAEEIAAAPDARTRMAFAVMGAERLPGGNGERDADEAAARVTDFLLHALGAPP